MDADDDKVKEIRAWIHKNDQEIDKATEAYNKKLKQRKEDFDKDYFQERQRILASTSEKNSLIASPKSRPRTDVTFTFSPSRARRRISALPFAISARHRASSSPQATTRRMITDTRFTEAMEPRSLNPKPARS